MPVNSKKQGQGQTGKKGDDAKTKTRKTPDKENVFGKTEMVTKAKGSKNK